MAIEIRGVGYESIQTAMKLIEEVFDEFIARDYSEQGIKIFKENFITNQKFIAKYADEREKMYGAYDGGDLVGCLSVSLHHTISCVFVKREYQRKGIASKLLNTVIDELKKKRVTVIKLNASPYGLPFYKAIGFIETGDVSNYNGIIYTPMMFTIDT